MYFNLLYIKILCLKFVIGITEIILTTFLSSVSLFFTSFKGLQTRAAPIVGASTAVSIDAMRSSSDCFSLSLTPSSVEAFSASSSTEPGVTLYAALSATSYVAASSASTRAAARRSLLRCLEELFLALGFKRYCEIHLPEQLVEQRLFQLLL